MSEPRILAVGEEFPAMVPTEPPTRAHKADPKGKPNDAKRKAGERFATINAFVDSSMRALTRAEMAVWYVLWRDTRDGTARTSYDDLAGRAGLNRRSVSRSLRLLEGRGLVSVVRRGSLRKGPSAYRVHPLERGTE